VTELQRDFRCGIGVDKIDDPPPRGLLFIIPHSSAARRNAGVTRDAGHFGKNQSRPADRARAVMHEMKVARNTFVRRIHAHG
jgi:hypothetical protein